MAETSKIEWTEATWNPWHGCKKVSRGCQNCYMFAEKKRYGQDPNKIVRSKTTFNDPLKWVKKSDGPRLVFTCSWSDFFIAEADEWRPEAWNIIRATPEITYQICTKRPERILDHLPSDWRDGWPNVHLLVSVESNEYRRRIAELLAVPAVVRGISAEPLLGPLEITNFLYVHICPDCGWIGQHHERPLDENRNRVCPVCRSPYCADQEPRDCNDANGPTSNQMHERRSIRGLDWVILGGESDPDMRVRRDDYEMKVRPFDLLFAKGVIRQCQDAGVPIFVKQLGANPVVTSLQAGSGVRTIPVEGVKDPKGADPAEWPEVMRVRQMPEVRQ